MSLNPNDKSNNSFDNTNNLYVSSETPWQKLPSLHPEILQCLLKKGFNAPTQIQSQTLSDYPFHNDFIIASMTVIYQYFP